jgi:hypothetical protein
MGGQGGAGHERARLSDLDASDVLFVQKVDDDRSGIAFKNQSLSFFRRLLGTESDVEVARRRLLLLVTLPRRPEADKSEWSAESIAS